MWEVRKGSCMRQYYQYVLHSLQQGFLSLSAHCCLFSLSQDDVSIKGKMLKRGDFSL